MEPTTTKRARSVRRTATMSFSTASRRRIPASKPRATMSTLRSSAMTATCTPGCRRANSASTAGSRPRHTSRGTLRRSVPTSSLLGVRAVSRAASAAARAGRALCASRRPASVRFTLRVVRTTRELPSSRSSRVMAWLTAEGEIPRLAAAREKLSFSATARNTGSCEMPPCIDELRFMPPCRLRLFSKQSQGPMLGA